MKTTLNKIKAHHPCIQGWKQLLKHLGKTKLIAAMRCYVASKLGDEVEIPEELK